MEVDPRDPLNALIVNLDKAPRNAGGLVEFTAPFFILKPADISRGNHKILYGINNRGNKQTLGYFNYVPAGSGINDPLTAADAGDGFLMRLGYTIVDAGWRGDVANLPGSNVLFPNLPVATQPDGSPIIAAVRIEYSDRTIPATGSFSLPLEGSRSFNSYPTSDTNTAHSTLTIRDQVSDQGQTTPIAADQWAFGTCPSQTRLAVAALTACIVHALNQQDKTFQARFEQNLTRVYKNIREMELSHIGTMETLTWTRKFLNEL
jgi:hypothetical protein